MVSQRTKVVGTAATAGGAGLALARGGAAGWPTFATVFAILLIAFVATLVGCELTWSHNATQPGGRVKSSSHVVRLRRLGHEKEPPPPDSDASIGDVPGAA